MLAEAISVKEALILLVGTAGGGGIISLFVKGILSQMREWKGLVDEYRSENKELKEDNKELLKTILETNKLNADLKVALAESNAQIVACQVREQIINVELVNLKEKVKKLGNVEG